MKEINLRCPDDTWPDSFSGTIVIGINEVLDDNRDLWIAFEIEKGNNIRTSAHIADATGIPENVDKIKPRILAIAPRTIWELLRGQELEAFHQEVEEGRVSITGDFRFFVRHAANLLKIVEEGNFWLFLDPIIEDLLG